MIALARRVPGDVRRRRRCGPIATGSRSRSRSRVFGIVWIGIPFAHAVLLRELPDHGAALLVDVLVATFVADTAAYAGGRLFGRHRLAPALSPNKTLEGLAFGFVGGTLGFWFAGLYQDWLPGVDALVMGVCIAALAPVGDLFESMIKRDLADQGLGHDLRPPRRAPRPPRRGPVHDRRRLLPVGRVRLLSQLGAGLERRRGRTRGRREAGSRSPRRLDDHRRRRGARADHLGAALGVRPRPRRGARGGRRPCRAGRGSRWRAGGRAGR